METLQELAAMAEQVAKDANTLDNPEFHKGYAEGMQRVIGTLNKAGTPVKLSYMERRALRMAAQLALDDDDTKSKMYDWQIESLQSAVKALPVEGE